MSVLGGGRREELGRDEDAEAVYVRTGSLIKYSSMT